MSTEFNPQSRSHDLLACTLGVVATGILISIPWQIDTSGPYPFYKGPVIFPLMTLCLIIFASVPSAIRLVKPDPETSWTLDGAGRPVKPAVMLGLILLYLAGLVYAGLEISTVVILFSALYYLGHRSLRVLIGVPVILSAILYLTFKFMLDIYFPTPVLFELFME